MTESLSADVLIVGGGTAGAVLAHRLSENRATRVILVEAGGEANSPLVALPVGFAKLVAHPRFDWRYPQAADHSINGRTFLWSAGKLLGGSSSINGQVYIRGLRHDYQRWVDAGAAGWDFDSLLPYFMKAEDWCGAPSRWHGQGGPMAVSPMREAHPLCHRFLAACAEIGLPLLDEYGDGGMDGSFLTVATQRDGWRCGAEKAYLRPVRSRPNLQVLTRATVQRIEFEGSRACGLTLRRDDGTEQRVRAQQEVILCAGAMGSPALLLRSGIGGARTLADAGIPVRHALDGVGENLQEHTSVGQNRFVNVPTLNAQMGALSMLGHGLRFLNGRRGILGAPAVQAMAMARTTPDAPVPEVQLHFLPLAYDIDFDTVSTANANMPKEPAVTVNATLCQPRGRGRVVLDAQGAPRVEHQFLGDEQDLATLVRAQRLLVRLFDSAPLQQIVIGARAPSTIPGDDAAWIDYCRAKACPAYHPVGTCRMGCEDDAAAVVDLQLRVRGVQGLRVVDASIMPTITSSNTNAPVIAIAEKAADLIRLA